jgi:CRP-like cAMP-binding protein
MFARLPMSALERIAGALEPAAWEAGSVIMAEGDPGDAYVIIAEGIVEVSVAGRPINRCGPGEGIGEIALIQAIPRTATATAVVATSGYRLSSPDFLAAVAGPTSAAAAAAIASERLARTTA